MEHKVKNGELLIVATPIGNLGDITYRAVEQLKSADAIYCEDTRHSRKLLDRYAVVATPLLPYHEHNATKTRPTILRKLEEGQKLALISDAGTPLISDPGYKLVSEARELGIRITPLPGACAAVTALCAAGLPSDQFFFHGFLPPKEQARRKALSNLLDIPGTLIFYESPKRLSKMLVDAAIVLGGEREATIGRELTKQFEEFRKGSLQELAEAYAEEDTPKGEIVVLIGAKAESDKVINEAELEKLLRKALETLPVKQAANQVAEQTGLSKRDCYQLALKLKDKTEI